MILLMIISSSSSSSIVMCIIAHYYDCRESACARTAPPRLGPRCGLRRKKGADDTWDAGEGNFLYKKR